MSIGAEKTCVRSPFPVRFETGFEGTSPVFDNRSGGILHISQQTAFVDDSNIGFGNSKVVLRNEGTIDARVTAESGNYPFDPGININLQNDGVLDITGTTLDLADGGRIGGTIMGGVVRMMGGFFTLDNPAISAGGGLVLDGGTISINAGAFPSDVALLGGEIDGSGTLVNPASGPGLFDAVTIGLTIGGGLTVQNEGTIGFGLSLGDVGQGGTLVNEAGATLKDFRSDGGSAGVLINHGQMLALAGTQIVSRFVNDGTLTATGAIYPQPTSLTLYNGGTLGGTIKGEQLVIVQSGTLNVLPTLRTDASYLIIAGGDLAVSSAATIAMSLQVGSSGTQPPSANHVDGPATLTTTGSVDLFDAVLGGGLHWTASGVTTVQTVAFGDGIGAAATLTNDVLGLMVLEAQAVVANAVGGSGSLVNTGLITTSGASFNIATIGVALRNDGVVRVAAGTLDVTGPLSGNGIAQIQLGATLETSAPNGETIAFDGADGTLRLHSGAGAIHTTGLARGDTIALDFASVGSATISGNTLTVTGAGHPALTFLSSTSLAGDAAQTASDGLGGLLVTIVAAPTVHLAAAVQPAPVPSIGVWTPAELHAHPLLPHHA